MKALLVVLLIPFVLAALAYGFCLMGATSSFFLATIGINVHWAVCGAISIFALLAKGALEAGNKRT